MPKFGVWESSDEEGSSKEESESGEIINYMEARNTEVRSIRYYANKAVTKEWRMDTEFPYYTSQSYSHFKIYESYTKEAILRSTEDTKNVMVRKLEGLEGKFFSYYHLQMALRLQWKLQNAQDLYRDLFSGNLQKTVTVPTWSAIEKEFMSIYGPVDLVRLSIVPFIERYAEQNDEYQREYLRLRTFLEEMVKMIGRHEVLNRLQILKEHASKQVQGFLQSIKENVSLYRDLNPMTNETHTDWFLMPRVNPTFLQYGFLHPELEHLAEYQIPAKTRMVVEGVWLPLVDCCVTNSTRISEDPYYTVREIDSESERYRRECNWKTVYNEMYILIAKYPLGISLSRFFALFNQGKWNTIQNFLEPLTFEQVVKQLPEVFATEEVEGGIILYPSFMRDVASSNHQNIMYRLWKRLVFLVRFHGGGKIRSEDAPILYSRYFKSRVKVTDFNFQSVEEFVKYCKGEWDHGERETVEIINKCCDSLLVHRILQNDDGN